MKKIFSAICLCFLLAYQTHAQELTKVTFMPHWTPQSQFAGFYMAKEKGFYEEEGLDLTIRHIGMNSTASTLDMLKSGEVHFAEQQLLQSVIEKSDGADIVNIMQITQHSGLVCVGKDTLSSLADLNGKNVGRWRRGYSELCDMLTQYENIQVNWIPFISSTNAFIFGALDATLCYSYNELVRLYLAKGEIPEENILRFSEIGIDGPEDGIYVLDKFYKEHPETVEKFIRATRRGWQYVAEHFDEAVELSISYSEKSNISTNRIFQKLMLKEYLSLMTGNSGKIGFEKVEKAVFDNTVEALSGCNMILTKPVYEETIK